MSDCTPSPDARARRRQELSRAWSVPEADIEEIEQEGELRLGNDAMYFGDQVRVFTVDNYGYRPGLVSGPPPAVAAALRARDFAVKTPGAPDSTSPKAAVGNPLDEFLQRHLVLRGGPQWREAASTVLAEDWFTGMPENRSIDEVFIGLTKPDVQAVHRQLVPLWRRKVSSSRVRTLEAPLGGSGLTLLDVVSGELRMDDLVFESCFDDPRIGAVLARLTAEERRVAMAWAHPCADTWTEAARFAGAADPEAFGERVRRKLKRLGIEYTRRRASAVQKPEA